MKIMTHEERAERRLTLATEAETVHPSKVAKRHKVTERLVRLSCFEHKIVPASTVLTTRVGSVVAILAGILHGLTPTEIADELGVSKVRIHQIKREARTFGTPVRGWPRKSLRSRELSA